MRPNTIATTLAYLRSILAKSALASMTGNPEQRNIIIIGSPPSTLPPSSRIGTDIGINMQAEGSSDARRLTS